MQTVQRRYRSAPLGDSRLWERLVAYVAVFLLGVRYSLTQGVTPGYVVALALLPIWFGVLRKYYGARFFMGLTLAGLPFAVLLGQVDALSHAFSYRVFFGTAVVVVGLVCGIGVILWCLTFVPARTIGALFGVGLLVTSLTGEGQLTASNPLKFGVAIPVAVIVLSLVNVRDRFAVQLVAVLGLAAFGALVDARSFFAICLLAGALICWQMRPVASTRRASWGWTALLIGALGAGVYFLGTTLVVDGYLGAETQARSIAQIETSGSLILGGRPELAATIALFQEQPWGFGSGMVPNLHDINVAKAGMIAIGYEPNNGYVEGYMFGNTFNLHSIVGDTWASFGAIGLLISGTILYLVVRGAAARIASRNAGAILIVLSAFTLWNLLFSPFYGSVPYLTLTMGLVLLPRSMMGSHHGSELKPRTRTSAKRALTL